MRNNSHGSVREKILLSREGSVFVLGSWMLILWIAVVTVLWRVDHPFWLQILTMGFTELFLGRAAAIAQATQVQMHPILIVFLATYVDAMTLFILYPLLILSYRGLFERHTFEKHVKPIFESAEKSLNRFVKYKVVGVFAFVWFPFWMTGVVVGAVLGYLLGLKVWMNMATVTVSTMTAALCWVYAYDRAYEWMGRMHETIPIVATLVILVVLAVARVVTVRRNVNRAP